MSIFIDIPTSQMLELLIEIWGGVSSDEYIVRVQEGTCTPFATPYYKILNVAQQGVGSGRGRERRGLYNQLTHLFLESSSTSVLGSTVDYLSLSWDWRRTG